MMVGFKLLFFIAAQIRQNNSQNSKAGQLLGSKATSVRNIMEHYDAEAVRAIIQYTLEVGHEQSPWSDDSLSSKKCVPGYQQLASDLESLQHVSQLQASSPAIMFRIKSNAGPVWQARGKISKESNRLMAPWS